VLPWVAPFSSGTRFTDEDTPTRPPGNLQELCLRIWSLFKH